MKARKLLLIASTGGHLAELVRIAPILKASADSVWVTFDTPQSRSLLAGKRTVYLPYIRPRGFLAVLRAAFAAWQRFPSERFAAAYSTGSAIILALVPILLWRRIPIHYVESLARSHSPSTTGRILHAARIATMYAQGGGWRKGRWKRFPSILSQYDVEELTAPPSTPRLLITVGTIQPFRFDELIDAVLRTGMAGEDTLWQVGATDRTDLPGRVVAQLPDEEFNSALRSADVVISHAGVGTLFSSLDAGRVPILAIRRANRNEHIDDHQAELKDVVNAARVGIVVETTDLTRGVICKAASYRVVRKDANDPTAAL